jgi:hypothetical protein
LSEEENVELIPQPHGGALRAGGTPGNRGGRPPSRIRKRLASIVDEKGVDYIRRVLDGKVKDAKVSDVIMAFDKAAKYGIGVEKELSQENVRERVRQTMEITTSHLPALIASLPADDVANALFDLWEPIWS